MKSIDIDSNIAQLIDQNALFVINHSGGKDSQAMMIQLLKVKHHPELLAKYIELEKKTGYTMHASMKPLAELVKAGKAIEIKSIPQGEFDFC